MATLLGGASCEKKSSSSGGSADVIGAIDRAGPVDTTPLPGVDVSGLSAKQQDTFYRLAASLTSPCGKAHSLRTSIATDTACKRAPFAGRYVAALLEDEAPEKDVRELYASKYKPDAPPETFKLDGAPHHGPTDAPVQLVEFFDYGCPVCVQFHPELEAAIEKSDGAAVVYFKMFPLVSRHPDSMSAAQAAVAAAAQGKFDAMHKRLFERSPAHGKDAVVGYARELGLDLPTFEADYAAAEPKVRLDMAEGEAHQVNGTPTVFFAGRRYEGPLMAKYLALWIAEEAAVNR
ncbi:MAG: thioredoxin domain-containing protein [Kofleriaceae bacterium]